MTIGTALPPSEILSGIEDKRVVVTLAVDIESNDWGFLLALNPQGRRAGYRGDSLRQRQGLRGSLPPRPYDVGDEPGFRGSRAKSREDLARLGDELWGAGGIRAGRSVCVKR